MRDSVSVLKILTAPWRICHAHKIPYIYIYVCMCIIESLCHTPETYMTLLINYPSIKKDCKRYIGATRIRKVKGIQKILLVHYCRPVVLKL